MKSAIPYPVMRFAAIVSLLIAGFFLLPRSFAGDEPQVPVGIGGDGVVVALFDTGVNYTLPEIANRLARDGEGLIIGFDFHDDDFQPFDALPGDTRSEPRRHGTTVASILLREAPGARLAPYRFKAGDPVSFARMVAHAALGPTRIVCMSLGGRKREDWELFHQAVEANPQILFVVSAGNDGANVDDRPLYPPSFGLANILVVAATDTFGRFMADANWGPETVDISAPAERIQALDFSGALSRASGSSFAAPRIAALAARILQSNENLDTAALKARVLALAGPNPSERKRRTKHGWIADPATVAFTD